MDYIPLLIVPQGIAPDTATFDITINNTEDAFFSYSSPIYCLSDMNPSTTVTGTIGGVFSIDNTGTINASTGEIDITASGAGLYTISYRTIGTCPDTVTTMITLTSASDASITAVGPFCQSDISVNLVAVNAGGVWSGPGITDAVLGTFDPSSANTGNNEVIYTITNSCGDADTMTVLINATTASDFNYNPSSYCLSDDNPTPIITGATGGTFSIDNGGDIDLLTGEINLTTAEIGTYQISYQASGACPESSSETITINDTTTCSESDSIPFALFIPSAFTPDGDDLNEKLMPQGFGISAQDFSFLIFNKWGEVVYESNELTEGWDATSNNQFVQSGIYTWKITYKNLESPQFFQKSGRVNVIR